MSEKEHISNLIWIIAIVVLLTFLIVVISWMSSGKLKVEKTEEPAKTSEINAESKTFLPESKTAESQPPIAKEEPVPVTSEEQVKKESPAQELEKNKEKETSPPPAVEPQPVIETKAEEPKENVQNPKKDKNAEVKKENFALQVGAFSSAENAKSFAKKLSAKGYKTSIKQKGNLTAVLIVDIPSRQEAADLKEKLTKENIQSSIISNP
jgi:cell division protein FtsN